MTIPIPEDSPEEEATRSGYVTLVGRPNAGKSTLMNALLGERLSIVTPKAQTTWQRVTGILTTDRAQMVFLDTPGLLDPRDLLQHAMLAAALEALAEADVVLLVLDGPRAFGPKGLDRMVDSLADRPPVPLLVAINKMDLMETEHLDGVSRWVSQELGGEPFTVCARDGIGRRANFASASGGLGKTRQDLFRCRCAA